MESHGHMSLTDRDGDQKYKAPRLVRWTSLFSWVASGNCVVS
jgi:hypothetical protein